MAKQSHGYFMTLLFTNIRLTGFPNTKEAHFNGLMTS